jgi:hypothetical protein
MQEQLPSLHAVNEYFLWAFLARISRRQGEPVIFQRLLKVPYSMVPPVPPAVSTHT